MGLVHADAEREDVGAAVDLVTACLLGRHVAVLALEHPGVRVFLLRVRLRDAEVEQLHVAVPAHHDVVRADVAVDDVERLAVHALRVVHVIERGGHVREDLPRDGIGDPPRLGGAPHDLAKRHAVHPLERHDRRAVDLAALVDVADVGMVEARRHLAFLEEHSEEVGVVRELGQDALENDVAAPVLAALAREEDLGHAAPSDSAEDLELAELCDRGIVGDVRRREERSVDYGSSFVVVVVQRHLPGARRTAALGGIE
jgi:hypothetical protein